MINSTDSQTVQLQNLTNVEIDAIGEILNISMGAAATAVSTLLGKKVNITTPSVTVLLLKDLVLDNLEPAIGIEIEYIEGLSGKNLLAMKKKDIKAIVNLLLSDMDGPDDDAMNEIQISAASEIMNQMMGASSTALSSFLGKVINISTPKQFDIRNKLEELENEIMSPYIVSVKFIFEVEDLLKSEFLTVLPIEFTKELVGNVLNFENEQKKDNSGHMESNFEKQTAEGLKTAAVKREKKEDTEVNVPKKQDTSHVSVKPVKLPAFDYDNFEDNAEPETDNFSLIMGVPLDVSVEIGRTRMAVKNILEVRQGSIIELDRQAGDPVDVIVNGQHIAKGDVVIVDDYFGVRITEILSKKDISQKIV